MSEWVVERMTGCCDGCLCVCVPPGQPSTPALMLTKGAVSPVGGGGGGEVPAR